MEEKMVKVRWLGSRSICKMPGFYGRLEKNGEAKTTEDNYERELKNHKDWELVKENKTPKVEFKKEEKKEEVIK